jgi:Flp pilus assembly protein TadD
MEKTETLSPEEKRQKDGRRKTELAVQADRAFEEGDIAKAVRIYELLVNRVEPENRRALSNLLYLYGLRGNWVSARELIKKRHGLDTLVYAYALGAIHGFRRNEIKHLVPFARLDGSGRLKLLLGVFYERDGEMKKAFRWYEAGYAVNPGDPYVAYAYARILDMANRGKEAAKIYERIVQMPFAQKDLRENALQRLREIRRAGRDIDGRDVSFSAAG